MIYLLDTDMLIFMIRGLKPGRRESVRTRAARVMDQCRSAQAAGNTVGLSAITVSEMEFGAQNSADYETEITAVGNILAPFEIFDYESVACPAHYGRVRAELERRGIPIGSMDLLISAHALALEGTLVTNDTSHFQRVTGLRTVNWVSES